MVDIARCASEHFSAVLLMKSLKILASIREHEADLDVALSRGIDTQSPVLARIEPLLVLVQDHLSRHGWAVSNKLATLAICVLNWGKFISSIDCDNTEATFLDARQEAVDEEFEFPAVFFVRNDLQVRVRIDMSDLFVSSMVQASGI